MQIGRKIYYELATGNVIVETSERQGDVVETTETQDWQLYSALQPYQQSAVGVLQLNFGDNATNFATYPYHVDITQNPPVIVWDTTATDLASAQSQKIAQLQSMFDQTLNDGFNSSATGTQYTYGFCDTDQSNMNQELGMISAGLVTSTATINWGVKSGAPVTHTTSQFKQVCTDGYNFKWAQVNQLRNLIGQVKSATTVSAVNMIQWVPAAY